MPESGPERHPPHRGGLQPDAGHGCGASSKTGPACSPPSATICARRSPRCGCAPSSSPTTRRDKMLATLDEMQTMTEATLAFAREEATRRADAQWSTSRRWLESLCCRPRRTRLGRDLHRTAARIAVSLPAGCAAPRVPQSGRERRALRRARARQRSLSRSDAIEISDRGRRSRHPGSRSSSACSLPFVRLGGLAQPHHRRRRPRPLHRAHHRPRPWRRHRACQAPADCTPWSACRKCRRCAERSRRSSRSGRARVCIKVCQPFRHAHLATKNPVQGKSSRH